MSGLAGRNSETRAIVTGGAQGIGFAVAEALADEGCRALALIGRSQEKGDKAVATLKKSGVDAIFISADVAKVADCTRAVATALAHFGTLNALVNAAATSARGSLVETSEELFDTIFDTNVRGPFFLMQGLVAHLLERKAPGSIVNVLSMSAHAGQSFLTPYSTSKGALMTLTKNVASSYRKNRIRCNAVLPGWMDTEGEAIVRHPDVHGVSFTGSTEVGRHLGALAGGLLKPISLELGGNNAFIVLDDADPAAAASAGAWGAFLHQGQICMAASRHLVHRSLVNDYVAHLSTRAAALRLGAAGEPECQLAPVITDEAADAVKAHYGDAGLVLLIEALGLIDGRIRAARCLRDLSTHASNKEAAHA